MIASFTPPENKQEQSELDFIEFKDLPGKHMTRLFSTSTFNNSIQAYYIKKLDKFGDTVTVSIDESRKLYSNSTEGGGEIGYTTQISNLIMEFKKIDEGYKLSRYYHSKPSTGISKYEGLYAY